MDYFYIINAALAGGIATCVLAASIGISRVGAAAMEAMARQPEAAGKIRMAMMLACGLIEGIAIIGCFLSFAKFS